MIHILMRREQMSERMWTFLHSFETMLSSAEGMTKKEIRGIQHFIEEMMVPYAGAKETKKLDEAIVDFLGMLGSKTRKTIVVGKSKTT